MIWLLFFLLGLLFLLKRALHPSDDFPSRFDLRTSSSKGLRSARAGCSPVRFSYRLFGFHSPLPQVSALECSSASAARAD
jgi:hypothetical protein